MNAKNKYYIINEAKSLFFDKFNKSDKPLARLAFQTEDLMFLTHERREKLSSL